MADTPTLEIVKAYQDAWIGRDFETAARYIADDVTFHSPLQHLTTAEQFLPMIAAFAQRVEPRWELVSATPNAETVLLLYRLFTTTGNVAVCADFFTLREGRITSEILGFDPAPFR